MIKRKAVISQEEEKEEEEEKAPTGGYQRGPARTARDAASGDRGAMEARAVHD